MRMIKTLKRYKFWLSAVSLKFGVISMGRRFFQGSCRVNHPTMRLALSAVVLNQGSAARYHRLPVASTSRPSLRIPVSSALIEFVDQGKDLPLLTSMTLCWRDEADSAVSVFVVLPMDKITHPASCSSQGLEALGRPLRAVLQCAEKRLRVWIVIIDTRPAAGRCYAHLDLEQAGTFGHSFEFHFCRSTLGRVFGIGHHLTSFGTGSFAPGIRRHFSNALAPSDFGHRQVEWRPQHLEQFGFALRGIVRHNGSLFAPGV